MRSNDDLIGQCLVTLEKYLISICSLLGEGRGEKGKTESSACGFRCFLEKA